MIQLLVDPPLLNAAAALIAGIAGLVWAIRRKP